MDMETKRETQQTEFVEALADRLCQNAQGELLPDVEILERALWLLTYLYSQAQGYLGPPAIRFPSIEDALRSIEVFAQSPQEGWTLKQLLLGKLLLDGFHDVTGGFQGKRKKT